MQMFLDSKDLGALEDSLDEKDYARAAELSHGVKGMSGNVSLPLLFDVSTRLNDQLKLGPPDEQTVAEYRVVLDETKKQVLAEMERIKAGQ
jgi:HPt (histidine-containing phosphotransfer) domain-containing protein